MKTQKVSLKDVLDRDDGPFWDRLKASPEWGRLDATIRRLTREAQVKEWGEPCPDFDPECCACVAWRNYEALQQPAAR